MWTIRPAQQTDSAQIAACVDAAYRHYTPLIGKTPSPMLVDYAEVIREHSVWVATVPAPDVALSDAKSSDAKQRIAGVIVLIEKGAGILLDNIAVHPDHQRQGLGRRLMHFAEEEAVRRGYSAIDLYTHLKMVENIALYHRLGYVDTARRIVDGYARVYMQKNLPPAV